ncbi:hypothetical protein PVL29_011972 [Vitis rotundifolia]|uniref:Uncharacterized protein n=1 Tax=Vitis rotundifolia TaxID=103349 RepID=A0AA38ZPU0_VITRO|nr:hypothetical protein PVL29_011972 [Vitis rotundifolia]
MQGQACRKGEAKSTYGTGAFILLNTGEEVIESKHGLLTTLGSVAIAGAAIQQLRDRLGIISIASKIEELTAKVDSLGGVYLVYYIVDPVFCLMLTTYFCFIFKRINKNKKENSKCDFLFGKDGL